MLGLTAIPRHFPRVITNSVDGNAPAADGTTFSDTGRAIGDPDPRRQLLMPLAYTSASRTLNSFSIGGVAGTIIANQVGAMGVALGTALVPTGTSATVSQTFSSTVTMRFYRLERMLYFRKGTAFDADTAAVTATSISATVRVPPLGYAYGVAASNGAFTSWDAPVSSEGINGPNETLYSAFGEYKNLTRQFVDVTFKANKSGSSAVTLAVASFWGDN